MSESILDVADLRKSFNGAVANDGITLSIEAGEFHGIIGPNGSGKTTLFNTVTGFLKPDSGRVRFDGEDIVGLSPDDIARRGLVRTFQVPALFAAQTVRENLLSAYAGGLRDGLRTPSRQRERAEELLQLLELESVAETRAVDISGGQQKLLELGRAMMRDPACLLLDEPTGSVNPSLQERLLTYLREVNATGTTIVIIEHDMDVIADVSDRISVLNGGRIITQGTFTEVTSHPDVRDAYLGGDPGSATEPETTAANSNQTGTGAGGATAVTNVEQTRRKTDLQSAQPGRSASGATKGEPFARLVGRNIVTGYGNHTVLDGVSIRSRDGITCVFGPNGSGKSTLLKALTGIIPVWSGSVNYRGRPMTGHDPHEFIEAGIATVPQVDMIFDGLTVRENLQLGATVVSDDNLVEARLDSVLDAFPPLEAHLSSRADSLSGGQRTMLGFGRAMMTGGDVYLLDEPSSSLDPSITDDIFDVVKEFVDRDSQVIIVEQNVRKALEVADYVYILAQGAVRFEGPPDELRDESMLLRLYLGMD